MNLDQLRSSPAAVITIAAVAGLLDVDERTVRRGCEDGQIPSIRVGRRVLVVREKLLAMLTAPHEKSPGVGAETPAEATPPIH